ncbi:Erythritol-mannosyl-transferase invovled in MEL production [Sporisorium reilianum f. sp. reilianum]|uniref:Erythritol-mannosyl-transferase invovled in MEL production n=1 Tax=Sporisorium reilianum f. sp. reilianum TaxID=72559 RepID=A0A2N8UF30_9BASI|nr:Erythritol-mannosyl-transferase invovled in MEL production [Sporisorium reilianum f. sp. reilianum]
MKVALLANPARGEINVLLATAYELIRLGHDVTFLTGSSFRNAIAEFRSEQNDPVLASRIHFSDLGGARAVEDFTRGMQSHLKGLRKPPGDYSSMEICQIVALVTEQEFRDAATTVRDRLLEIEPDMIAVDALSPNLVTGCRMTGLPWMFTVPCSPSLTATRKSLFDPHPMARRRKRSLMSSLENLKLTVIETWANATKKDLYARRALLKNEFGLNSMGFNGDSAIVPPLWKDRNCVGGIHFNTPGLTDSIRQPHQITFVGAGVTSDPENHDSPTHDYASSIKPISPALSTTFHKVALAMLPYGERDEDVEWMDAAYAAGQSVVYLNMGSMFLWTDSEVRACLRAFDRLYQLSGGKIKLLFKLNKPKRNPGSPGSASPSATPVSPVSPGFDEKRPELDSRRPSGASTLVAEKLSEAIKNSVKLRRKIEAEQGYSLITLSEFEGLEYVRFTRWVHDQRRIYKHPALKVVIHHGGGNSFNEAIHYGLPQMVLSQWFDTHEYAILAERFGIGLRSKHAPYIDEDDMVNKMLRLLQGEEAEKIRRNTKVWSVRSRNAGGAPAAARLIETQALLFNQQKQAKLAAAAGETASVEALATRSIGSDAAFTPELGSSAASTVANIE